MATRLHRHIRFVLFTLAAVGFVIPAAHGVGASVPDRLTDKEFWALSERFSEANGEFQSDNFLSNERGYQVVIPDLLKVAKPNRVYLGVGPEQNYPYIIALKPKLAIIFDVRRGNLHEQLLYKALFELSKDRVEFLSKLFSRPAPAGLAATAPIADIMTAYEAVPASDAMYKATLKAVLDNLTITHGFALHTTAGESDADGIDYVFHTAFFAGGPDLTYSMAGRGARGFGRGGGIGGTYAEIQALTDGDGVNRGFLGSDENFRAMKDFEARNLLVPVVGDFAGPKAIRGVGQWLKAQGEVVSAFYLSNVEQYLNRNGVEDAFLCNVAQLPLDATSTFIYTGAGRNGAGYGGFGGGGGGRGGGGLNTTFLRSMADDAKSCTSK